MRMSQGLMRRNYQSRLWTSEITWRVAGYSEAALKSARDSEYRVGKLGTAHHQIRQLGIGLVV